MRHLLIGLGILIFGIFVGGVGLASAGIGVGIPMIPLGIYLSYRGWRIYNHNKKIKNKGNDELEPPPLKALESTKVGKVGLGILLILVGIGTSAILIGIPIFGLGVWFIYMAYKAEIKKGLE